VPLLPKSLRGRAESLDADPFRYLRGVLAFFLGGAVVYETVKPVPVRQEVPAIQARAEATPEITVDPWQNDELKDFHAVVQWESWVPESKGKKL